MTQILPEAPLRGGGPPDPQGLVVAGTPQSGAFVAAPLNHRRFAPAVPLPIRFADREDQEA